MKKRKWPRFVINNLVFEFIPFAENPRKIGYVRLETKIGAVFLGAIDESVSLKELKRLRNSLNAFIRRRQKDPA